MQHTVLMSAFKTAGSDVRYRQLTAAAAPQINSVGVRHLLARRGTLAAREAPVSANLQNRNSSVNFIGAKQHPNTRLHHNTLPY